MLVCILNGAILYDQFGRCFLSDTRDPRDIVGGVSHQGLELNDLRRCYLIFLQNLLCMEILDRCLAPGCLWQTDHNLVCRKLEKVTVSGKDCDIHPLFLTSERQCAKKVICLISCHGYGLDSHGREYFPDQRYLLTQF